MKKTTNLLFAMTVLVVLFVSACGGSPAPATQAAPAPVEIVPTQVPAEIVPTVAPEQPAATEQTFAPACQAATSCAAPAVVDTVASDRYCVEKIPYQNIFVDAGVAFEVLDPTNLTCADNGTIVDGKHVVECHGKAAWTTEVKFTNTACSSANLATGTGQCQDGLGFDSANNCCAPLSSGDAGSVIIKVNMGACS